jgi:hypothetical protein
VEFQPYYASRLRFMLQTTGRSRPTNFHQRLLCGAMRCDGKWPVVVRQERNLALDPKEIFDLEA